MVYSLLVKLLVYLFTVLTALVVTRFLILLYLVVLQVCILRKRLKKALKDVMQLKMTLSKHSHVLVGQVRDWRSSGVDLQQRDGWVSDQVGGLPCRLPQPELTETSSSVAVFGHDTLIGNAHHRP